MAGTQTEQLDVWRAEILADFPTGGCVDGPWVDAHIWFWLHSYADFARAGKEFTGASFSPRDGIWLLVCRVIEEGIPLVAFCSAQSPTACMRQLRRKLRDETLNFSRDRFR